MKRGLGRGLDALLGGAEDETDEGRRIVEIALSDIDPNPDQPRRLFDEEKLGQLAESMRAVGVIQPITVRRDDMGSRYTIIAGERRWRAARLAQLQTIPCIVREADEVLRIEIALIENLQRDDLTPIEEARAIQALMEECGLTQEAVSSRLGKSRSAVANVLRLLSLPEAIQQQVNEGFLSEGHARALVAIEDPEIQAELAQRAIEQGWSVRQVEEARRTLSTPKKEAARPVPDPTLNDIQDRLRQRLSAKVSLTGNMNRGRITIEYTSMDELDRLFEMMNRA